jgi:serine/threonine-protein kinase
MENRLRVTAGPDKGLTFTLPETGVQNIGKIRQHNEICLHDMKLSRVHCEVLIDEGRVVITDLDSESGVYVNGQRVSQRQLEHGDVIRVGDTEIMLESIKGAEVKEAPAVAGIDLELERPAAKESAATAPPPDPAATLSLAEVTKLSATLLGPYQLGAVLGQGHHGVVFRAVKDEKMVALKVFHSSFPQGEEEADRFVQAMKTRLNLRHPNLVTVFTVGRSQPYTWIAEEHVEGESLVQTIQNFGSTGVPEWQQSFRLAMHIGRALHFIHQQRLTHRNITPANILFRTTDNLFKLSDLLLTKALAGSRLRQAALRKKIQVEMGYFSPEQTQQNAVLDIRSDIYSLGAVAYVLLMGRPPCLGKTVPETIGLIRSTEPARPKELQPSIPETFERAILKMLSKRPEERFQTPAELLASLSTIAPEPV